MNDSKQGPLSSSEHQGTNAIEQNGDAVNDGPLVKRQCIDSFSDAGSSLMEVALLSTLAGPEVSAAAAEVAVALLCDGTRGVFGGEDDFPSKGLWSPSLIPIQRRAHHDVVSEINDRQNDIPLTLRLGTAVAIAFGAAAAHAKSLADEEDREIENLVATIIETQLKKLQYKITRFENLEVIMDWRRNMLN